MCIVSDTRAAEVKRSTRASGAPCSQVLVRNTVSVGVSLSMLATVGLGALPQQAPPQGTVTATTPSGTKCLAGNPKTPLDVQTMFPTNRAAQRMASLARDPIERMSAAGMAGEFMPDWGEWWSLEDVCTTLSVPFEHRLAMEALLEMRKRARGDAIDQLAQSREFTKFVDAMRQAGGDRNGALPDLETRAALSAAACRAVTSLMNALLSADTSFAQAAAALVEAQREGSQPRRVAVVEAMSPEAGLAQAMRGVQRLRSFDPATSQGKLLNTGVELTVHASLLLACEFGVDGGLSTDMRGAVLAQLAAWQVDIAPRLNLREKLRTDMIALMVGGGSLEDQMRRLEDMHARSSETHADILATTLRSARTIASLVAEHDADRSNSWLRAVYHALSPIEVGLTAGDAAIESAQRLTDASADASADATTHATTHATNELNASLASIRSSNLRACTELEGALIDAAVRMIGDKEKLREYLMREGKVCECNDRRISQADEVLARVTALLPMEQRDGVKQDFESARGGRNWSRLGSP